jgi:Domain of unknown function (DUF4177)
MKWEYRVLEVPISSAAEYEKGLNALGADGWELVSVATTHAVIAVFKRQQREQPKDAGAGT